MADALLSGPVSAAMAALSVGAIAYSVAGMKKESIGNAHGFDERYEQNEQKIPVMGVMGAFVFAAQMVNFTIPMTGSSGHIGGGILLAAMLGPYAGFLTLVSVLVVQCLFFADGGLLALGCNIFNLGVFSCLVAYPLAFKPIARRGFGAKNLTLASVLAVVVGLQLGAFGVVLETWLSGITEIPLGAFVALMQPIHLAIGVAEGLVTASVLGFVAQMHPELIDVFAMLSPDARERPARFFPAFSFKKALLALLVTAAVVGGGVSLVASAYPDGLEWSVEKAAGTAELATGGTLHEAAANVQESTALMPDYDFKSPGEHAVPIGTSVAGLAGGAMTLLAAVATGFIVAAFKKFGRKNAEYFEKG